MEEALSHLHQLLGLDDYRGMVVFHETCQTALLATIAIHLLFGRRGADKETPTIRKQPTKLPEKPKQQTAQQRIDEIDEILRKKKPKQL